MLQPRAMSIFVVLLKPGSVLKSLALVATKHHAHACGLDCHLRPDVKGPVLSWSCLSLALGELTLLLMAGVVLVEAWVYQASYHPSL